MHCCCIIQSFFSFAAAFGILLTVDLKALNVVARVFSNAMISRNRKGIGLVGKTSRGTSAGIGFPFYAISCSQ